MLRNTLNPFPIFLFYNLPFTCKRNIAVNFFDFFGGISSGKYGVFSSTSSNTISDRMDISGTYLGLQMGIARISSGEMREMEL